MILNIHGYNGSSSNSAYNVLKKMNFDIVSPQLDYDNLSPEKVIEILESEVLKNNVTRIVGTSLGGFYAGILSAHTDLPVVLINPCFMPFLHLPRLGYEGNINSYVKMFPEILNIKAENTDIIIGGNDEVIDTHDFTKKFFKDANIRIFNDGKHSGSTLPLEEYFSLVIDNSNNLQRFVDAQENGYMLCSDYKTALEEIHNGCKLTHWMWYVFPQIEGLGFSDTTKYFSIKNLNEAVNYYKNPVLGKRLIEISKELLALDTDDPVAVFGSIDAFKIRSCMTLFNIAVPDEPVFRQVLDKFCMGNSDYRTLKILESQLK